MNNSKHIVHNNMILTHDLINMTPVLHAIPTVCKSVNTIKRICGVILILLILGLVQSAHASSFNYQHGYNAGHQAGRSGVLIQGLHVRDITSATAPRVIMMDSFLHANLLACKHVMIMYQIMNMDTKLGNKMQFLALVILQEAAGQPILRHNRKLMHVVRGYNYAYNHFCGIHGRAHSE